MEIGRFAFLSPSSRSLKINAILVNIKINEPKLLNMRGYELATNAQNYTNISLTLYFRQNLHDKIIVLNAQISNVQSINNKYKQIF